MTPRMYALCSRFYRKEIMGIEMAAVEMDVPKAEVVRRAVVEFLERREARKAGGSNVEDANVRSSSSTS